MRAPPGGRAVAIDVARPVARPAREPPGGRASSANQAGQTTGRQVRTLLFQKFGVDVTAVHGVNARVGDTFSPRSVPTWTTLPAPRISPRGWDCAPKKVSSNHQLSVRTRPLSNRWRTQLHLFPCPFRRRQHPAGLEPAGDGVALGGAIVEPRQVSAGRLVPSHARETRSGRCIHRHCATNWRVSSPR